MNIETAVPKTRDMKMKKALSLLIVPLMFSSLACQAGKAGESIPANTAGRAGQALQIPAAPTVDLLLDDWASMISGLPASSDAFKKWEETASWKNFASSMDEHWASFASKFLQPMKTWAEGELSDAWPVTRTLLYPFGGPDMVTAFAFFPRVDKTILMGLEPTGNLPDFGRVSADWRDRYFKDMDSLMSDYLKRGYFFTQNMNRVFSAGRVDGALSIICFFLKRTGHSILSMERLVPNEKGEWSETPYETMKKRPKRPYGVRIDYGRPDESGEIVAQSVIYFACDLADTAFTKTSPLYCLFDRLEAVSTCMKSASYLLHYAGFGNMRNMILVKSLYVVQDDTGIPYRYFKNKGWAIQLYGVEAKPVADFSGVEQKDLKAAYDDPASNVKALPFAYGYHWKLELDNLLLMKRPQGTPGLPAAESPETKAVLVELIGLVNGLFECIR